LIPSVLFLLGGNCDSSGDGDSNGTLNEGTLTVSIVGAPSGAVGKLLYMGLFESGADPITSSLLATGEILLSNEQESHVMDHSVLDEKIILDGGAYDLYLWIDMNDNFDTVKEPEQSIDMTHKIYPFGVTINGDTTVTLLAAGFELFPG
jgi:hypothetical protein